MTSSRKYPYSSSGLGEVNSRGGGTVRFQSHRFEGKYDAKLGG